jgi:hypothetical protein
MNPLIKLKTIAEPLLITLALLCFGLLPGAQAVVPAPDGGYPGGNTAEGQSALLSLTTGGFNAAVGYLSLKSNGVGSFNTGVGAGTLLLNTADNNTAMGAAALLSNTMGINNTASGTVALLSNTTGGENTANGAFALSSNTTGSVNTAIGFGALSNNTGGSENTALGINALVLNSTGGSNTAAGAFALDTNTSGSNNTACGLNALFHNTDGNDNTAVGNEALQANTSGSHNTALGENAGSDVTTATNVICIGASGANVDNSCFIGNIRNAVVAPDAVAILIDSAGKLGTITGSSRRVKTEIKAMDNASESILTLQPVTFHYKSDKRDTPQFGLIAEQVAEVNPDLVVRDKNGEIYTVRYDAVNAMLLNEFLKEHKTVQEQGATIARQQKQIDALSTGLQKVSAQIEASKPAPQVVLNNP